MYHCMCYQEAVASWVRKDCTNSPSVSGFVGQKPMDLVTGHMHLFQRTFHQQELVHWGVCFESALSLALRLARAVERESSFVPHRRYPQVPTACLCSLPSLGQGLLSLTGYSNLTLTLPSLRRPDFSHTHHPLVWEVGKGHRTPGHL